MSRYTDGDIPETDDELYAHIYQEHETYHGVSDADILTDQATAAAANETAAAVKTLRNAESQIQYVNYHAYGKLDSCECASLLRALADVRAVIRSFSDLDIELHNAGR